MTGRILHPQWRNSQEDTAYPFAEHATLDNGEGGLILPGTFLDAVLFPVGGEARMYLTQVDLTHSSVKLYVGDSSNTQRSSVSFDLVSPPDLLSLADVYGRPAGVIVSESNRLAVFQSWDVGTHLFDVDHTEFSAAVCVPTPEVGLRGFLLDDGTVMAGDVWIVGDDGVVVRYEDIQSAGDCGEGNVIHPSIRIDIVGDPLFKRRFCEGPSLFATPKFLEQIDVTQSIGDNFSCSPDDKGNITVSVNNALAEDTVLRIRTTPDGLVFEAMGDAV